MNPSEGPKWCRGKHLHARWVKRQTNAAARQTSVPGVGPSCTRSGFGRRRVAVVAGRFSVRLCSRMECVWTMEARMSPTWWLPGVGILIAA